MLFLTVYDTAIDTVFICFLVDEEANKNSGTMMADKGLRDIVQKYEGKSKELANQMKENRGGTDMTENGAAIPPKAETDAMI